jgi:two-component SAPR family response regulator
MSSSFSFFHVVFGLISGFHRCAAIVYMRGVCVERTHEEAVLLGRQQGADVILADIQLADNSSSIDAVYDLLGIMEVPVIFITAFLERLLTGDRPEPAFLISKPFHETQVQSAVSQAMFFASTDTLKACKTV